MPREGVSNPSVPDQSWRMSKAWSIPAAGCDNLHGRDHYSCCRKILSRFPPKQGYTCQSTPTRAHIIQRSLLKHSKSRVTRPQSTFGLDAFVHLLTRQWPPFTFSDPYYRSNFLILSNFLMVRLFGAKTVRRYTSIVTICLTLWVNGYGYTRQVRHLCLPQFSLRRAFLVINYHRSLLDGSLCVNMQGRLDNLYSNRKGMNWFGLCRSKVLLKKKSR